MKFYQQTDGTWILGQHKLPAGTCELIEDEAQGFTVKNMFTGEVYADDKQFGYFKDENGTAYATVEEFKEASSFFFSSTAITWDDLSSSLILQPFKNQNAAIYQDFDEIEAVIGTGARLDQDWISWGKQLRHSYAQGMPLNPHIHLILEGTGLPNLLLKWRWYNNGEAPPAWQYLAHSGTLALDDVRGTMNILQFADFEKANARISSQLDVQIMRDVTNASGLFAGVDTYAGGARLKYFDAHEPHDTAGSVQRFYK